MTSNAIDQRLDALVAWLLTTRTYTFTTTDAVTALDGNDPVPALREMQRCGYLIKSGLNWLRTPALQAPKGTRT